MKRKEALEIFGQMENTLSSGGTHADAKLLLYRIIPKTESKELATFNFWVATRFLDIRHPHMIPLAFPWLKNAIRLSGLWIIQGITTQERRP